MKVGRNTLHYGMRYQHWMKVNFYLETFCFHRHYRYLACHYSCIFENKMDNVLFIF